MSWYHFWRPPTPLGYLQDPMDSRDLPFDKLGLDSSIPGQASVANSAVKVRSQGATQSCVGYAVSTALRLAYLKDGRVISDLSPRFIYYNARRSYVYGTVLDAGTYLREAMRGVVKLGACPETHCGLYPVNERPSWNAYRYAYQGRGLRGYYRIQPGNPDDVKRALASGRPVVGGWKVDSAFRERTGPRIITAVNQRDLIGGHAMVIEAYSGDLFQLHNSWGTSWREGGKVWVNSDFITKGYDLWAIDT